MLLLIGAFTTIVGYGQSSPQSSLFNQNILNFNSAYAGTKIGVHLDGSFRYQWLDLEGAPVSQFASAHLALPGIRSGFGISLYNDAIGSENNFSARFALARNFDLKRSNISVGLDLGIGQKALDGSELITADGQYDNGTVNHNDPSLLNERGSGLAPDLGAGILYRISRTMVGVSVRNIVKKSFALADNQSLVEDKPVFYVFAQHVIEPSYTIKLIPALLVKSNLVSHQLDVQLAVVFRETFQAGLGYRGFNDRTQDAAVAMVGYHFSTDLLFTYGYDIGLSGLKSVHSGSHELAVSYRIGRLLSPRGGKVIYNPRFL